MLSYIGGKSKIGKWIVEYYPEDMETYVETFGGMFWCYFNMNLEKSYLLKIHGKVVERPQYMLMRVSIGIHKSDLESAFETYRMMS